MRAQGPLFVRLGDGGRMRLFLAQGILSLFSLQLLMQPRRRASSLLALAGTMLGIAPTLFLSPSA